MDEPSKLRSLEESLKFAEDAYRKAAKVAGNSGQGMPMSLESWLHQARERHAVLSNMNPEQREVAIEEAKQEQLPALLATRDFLDQMLAAVDPGRGGTKAKAKKFRTNIIKQAKRASREAKKLARKK
jgi:hypothetical protein